MRTESFLAEKPMVHQLIFDYGDDILAAVAMPKQAFDAEAKLLLSLPRVGVAISNLGPEDIEADLGFALNGKRPTGQVLK